jgi:UDP-N-acetylglucosamine acyltransferase
MVISNIHSENDPNFFIYFRPMIQEPVSYNGAQRTMISPHAIVSPQATLADNVSIGAFSVIGPDVQIGRGTWIGPHVVISGPTRIGEDNKIFQFASLGEAPQDLGYQGEPTQLLIGDRNQIRENVTISRGTVKGGGVTRVGSDNLIMAYVHIAHDCLVGNKIIFSNAASLAGHVEVQDGATLGGFTLVHQFCRVGAHAFTSMGSALNRDLTPFTMASGNYARAIGINKVGLARKGFSKDAIDALKKMFRFLVHQRGHSHETTVNVRALAAQFPEAQQFLEFVEQSKRGVIRTGATASGA